MQKLSFLVIGACCAGAWAHGAQPDAGLDPDHDPAADNSLLESQVLSDDGWSLSKLKLRDATLYWENDGTVPNLIDNTDRFYTNGLGIELSFDPQISGELADRLSFWGDWDKPRFGMGLAIKQMIFTGVDITDPAPALDDHPYGGILYFAFSFQRADEHKHDHFELDLGVVGERSQAEAVQRYIHHVFPDENTPQGWSNQLANELAINATFERTWKTKAGEINLFNNDNNPDASGLSFEMLPAIGLDLGNVHTRARGQITLRAGMNLPEDFGPASLLGHKDHTVSATDWGQGDWSFYLYTTLGVDAVAHDIFLDGNTFASSRSVDSEPFVAKATVGLVTRYKSLYLGWSQTFQSEQYESQPNHQTWGAIVLGCSIDIR